MRAFTFCRTFALCFAFFLSEAYGNTPWFQEEAQSLFPNEEVSGASESKCPSGGCVASSDEDLEYPFLVFVSFSMPEASLVSLAQELQHYGGAFVVRGLPDNSFQEFLKRINYLKTLGVDAPFLIDPDSFEKYDVGSVPTIILQEEESFDKVMGNVPLSYALEIFEEKGETKRLAKQILSGSIPSKHRLETSATSREQISRRVP